MGSTAELDADVPALFRRIVLRPTLSSNCVRYVGRHFSKTNGHSTVVQCPLTWFLRKAAASTLERRLVYTVVHSVVAFWFATPRTPPLWQRDFFLVNYLRVAMLFGFGEKRCRKNLPLGGRD